MLIGVYIAAGYIDNILETNYTCFSVTNGSYRDVDEERCSHVHHAAPNGQTPAGS